MDLSTTYLGLKLPHPIIPGASPMGGDLEIMRRLEAAGAPAIVLPSLFEEQFPREVSRGSGGREVETSRERLPALISPEEYIAHLRRAKAALKVPVIASLNGSTPGGWLRHAREIEEAGADALELNIYTVETDPAQSALAVEMRVIEMILALKRSLRIPIALKLSPFYTAFAHFARELDFAGADGLVIFNRFYQPDIDAERRRVEPQLQLSTSAELPLRLRWLAILSGKIKCSLAATGGVHEAADVVKAVMAGAHAVQIASALVQDGPEAIEAMLIELEAWMRDRGHESLERLRGSLSLESCPDPRAYERANYMRMLQSWGEPADAP